MKWTENDIRPLKPPVEIKELPNLWPLVLFLLFILGILAIIYYFRIKKEIQQFPSAPPRPPEDIAREELERLLKMELIKQGKIKEYYFRISDIIRSYIEGRYRIFALDRTTWELYSEMKNKKIERAHIDKINDFLEECDLVKFAKYVPTDKEIENIYNMAKEIVEITTPKISAIQNG